MTMMDRRTLLGAIPAAAVSGLALAQMAAAQMAMPVAQQNAIPQTAGDFLVVSAESLAEDIKALMAAPGSKRLFQDKYFLYDLWVEKAKSAKEYEWHEHRDHILVVLDGATEYELGGTPEGTHANGPGEWLAPATTGAKKVSLKKGDTLIIRRGTLHRRSTADFVVFTLAAPVTPV
jgi:mannose-6-phosphate isomerase-like protein (cupin superfamily)